MDKTNDQTEKSELMVCGVDISHTFPIFQECNGKALNSVFRWNRSPYQLDDIKECTSVIAQRGFALHISKLDEETMDLIIQRYGVRMKKNLLLGAYNVLYEAECDSLMKSTGYSPVEQVYDEKDLDSIRKMISKLESLGVQVSEKQLKKMYPDAIRYAAILISTFGYIGATEIIADIKDGAGEISHSDFLGNIDLPKGGAKLSDVETQLLGHFISRSLSGYGWEREPDNHGITDQTSWECHIKIDDKRPKIHKGYGDIPFNFDLLNEYLMHILSKSKNKGEQ